jgi:hypothetical protein
LRRNVVVTNLFSGKSSIEPTSMSGWPCLMKGGRIVKPSTGAVTTRPIKPPRPSVVASSSFERGKRMTSPSPGSGIAERPRCAGIAGALGAGSSSSWGCVGIVRKLLVASRIQRNPKIAVITAPTTRTILPMISPTKMQAMPMAKPTGQMVGVGSCGVP